MGRDGSPTREDSKSRSHRRDDSESRKDSKRSHKRDRDDRDREVDRNGEKHSEKDRDRDRHGRKDRESRRSEREKSVEVGKKKDRESRRSEREKSVDEEKKKDRESRRSEKERSVDDYREKHKDRHRERARDKAKERDREDSVEVENEREKEREREDEKKERAREKEREREREREEEKKERAREKEREREREEEKKERAREKEREREREREEEKKERAREKEREREKAREKEREREREREKRERERGREEKDRERSRRRERHRDVVSEDEDVRDHDRKRRRREDDNRERDHEKSGKSRRHGEETEDGSPHKKSVEEFSEKKEVRSREEDMEEEQRKLDEEMEKRRRRVQEWQELKRLKEESEREKHGVASAADELTAGKTWTLDGESDDEEAVDGDKPETDMILDGQVKSLDEDEVGDAMAVDTVNEAAPPASQTEGNGATDEEEIDPLDAFMNSMVLPEVEKLSNAVTPSSFGEKNSDIKQEKNGNRSNGEQPSKSLKKSLGRIIPGEDSSSDYEDIEDDKNPSEDEDDEEFMKRVKKTKAEKILIVDHSKIEYPPFRKNFYIEVKEISRMTPEEVAAYRKQLELKIHGKDVPKPVKTWHQMGLSTKIIETIKKLNYEKPMPIQAQALPVIMSGRDCIGVAKTGSGKTLAFVLPMLRHIKDQEPLMSGDGPIGLIMAPTRELVQQIHSDIKKFSKVMGLTCVPVYGGSGVAQQISELKRGAEIVVCTPGRMIDILCTSAGKITNLRRVTYLVMDEADRMFDMGFEPQITRIVQNTQPGRQTVLFSATFPRQVETLARKVLNKPVEIQVGGRSVVNKDITQMVEVRPESERFLRLLELLGEWSEKGKILIFVHTQEKCDVLFRNLLKHGYPCLSLHGAKDQTDRESTISDFKTNVCNLLIATSVAARGLDVKELELVINYDAPNHYEDYVHRVGRTGRAGRKGCAITFISEEDARYAPDLLKALELSEQVVPDDLKALADAFMAKVNQGLEQAHGTGYGGSGFKFNEEEDEVRKAAKKAQAKEYGFEEDKSDSEDENDGVRKAGGDMSQQFAIAAAVAAVTNPAGPLLPNGGLPVSAAVVPGVGPSIAGDLAARATALAAAMNLQHNLAKIQANVMPEHYEAELEINDFAQNARWKVTHKETLGPISEWTGAAITTRGQYYPPGKAAGPGDRKLYLFIEGPTEQSVKRAKSELKRVLEDITTQVSSLPGSAQPGRYSVL